MKKRILYILFILLFMIMQTNAYAQGAISVTLNEPPELIKGKEVEYLLNVQFTDAPSNYSNLFVTLRVSDGLDYKSLEMSGVTSVPGKLETTATANAQNRYNYLTLRITDMAALNGAGSFNVKIKAVVNSSASVGAHLTNTYSVAYQTKTGNTDSYQNKQQSTAVVSTGTTTPTPQPEPTPTPQPQPQPAQPIQYHAVPPPQ